MSTHAEDFFSPWEVVIDSWTSANKAIDQVLSSGGPERQFAWRGLSDASYALHSSLYRSLNSKHGSYPDEEKFRKAEEGMLKAARTQWRFDQKPAMEIMAHLQHFGGPTRLLDVSLSPLIALWFATAMPRTRDAPVDGRLFAFDVTGRSVAMNGEWASYDLPWPTDNADWRRDHPLLWRPPNYNERISAQNSAFLIGGVPQVYSGDNAKYRKAPGDGSRAGLWNIDEVRRATSINIILSSVGRKPRRDSVPTYTFRIVDSAKGEIRTQLERMAGLGLQSIYPDIYGFAQNAAEAYL